MRRVEQAKISPIWIKTFSQILQISNEMIEHSNLEYVHTHVIRKILIFVSLRHLDYPESVFLF
jgi:hypothetical protein